LLLLSLFTATLLKLYNDVLEEKFYKLIELAQGNVVTAEFVGWNLLCIAECC